MSKSWEVKQIVKKIDKANVEIMAQKRKMRSEISNVGYWWKGSAANAFLSKYNEIDRDIQFLKNKIDELRVLTNKLEKLLEEEERESMALSSKIRW